MASFRHAVWPNTSETSTAETIWGSEVHPDWQVQQLLADVVVYYLEKSYARFCEVYGSAEEPSIQEVRQASAVEERESLDGVFELFYFTRRSHGVFFCMRC